MALSFRFLLPYAQGERRLSGIVIEAKSNYFLFLSGGKRYLVYEKDCLREKGDILSIYGEIKAISSSHQEGRFSFPDYLFFKGAERQISSEEIDVVFRVPWRLRAKEISFLSSFEEPTRGLLDSLLFGRYSSDNLYLSKASCLGIFLAFSSSGIYFGLYKRFLNWLFSLRKKKGRKELLVFLFLSLPAIFCLGKIGIRRIFFSSLIDAVTSLLKRKALTSIRKNALIGGTMFLFDPFVIFQSGFLLGFGLSLYLFAYRERLRLLSRHKIKKRLISALLANLFLLPMYMKGGSLSLMAPFASWVLAPLVLPFAALGYFGFFFLPHLSMLNSYASFLGSTLSFFESLPLSITVPGLLPYLSGLYYFLLFLCLYIDDFGLRYLKEALLFPAFCLCLLSFLPITHYFTYQVSFIDVGQGDSILVRIGRKAMMVDTGGDLRFDMAKEVLLPYLRKQNILSLEALAITHGDYDHAGAASSLQSNFRVKTTLKTADDFPYRLMGVDIHNLNPLAGSAEDSNDSSLVLSFNIDGLSFLLMGDAGVTVEKTILDGGLLPSSCDVLKVGHHGSKTSSSMEFLTALKPKEAIISCGVNNLYGHPDSEVLARLKEVGANIRRTDKEGSVVYRGYLKQGFSFF